MPEPEPVRLARLPVRFLAVAWGENLFAIIALVVASLIVEQRGPSAPGWVLPVIGLMLLLRFASPVYTWVTLQYSVAADGVWVARGILQRHTRFTSWHVVAAVQVDRPWSYRAAGLSRATVLQGGDQATTIVLPGVAADIADEMVRLAGVGSAPEQPSSGRGGVPIHSSSVRDLIIANLIYGKFAILGAAIALAVLDGLQMWGLQDDAVRLAAGSPLLVGCVVAVVIMSVGAVGTMVRFAGLQTTARDGVLRIRYGLFSTRERVISPAATVGIELRRNLLELALGRVRLSVMSLDSAARLGSNLVLPSLREDVAARIIAESFVHQVSGHRWRITRRRGPLLMAALTLLGTALAATFLTAIPVLVLRPAPVVGLVVFVAAFAAVHRLGSIAVACLHTDQEAWSTSVSALWVSSRQIVLDSAFVHVVTSARLGRRRSIVRLHYYAGRPRALTAIVSDPLQVRTLAVSIVVPKARLGVCASD